MNFWYKIRSYFSDNYKRQSWFSLIFFALLSLVVIRTICWQSGTVGFRHDWSTPATASEIKLWFEHALYPWIQARGGFSVSYLSDFLIRLSVGGLSFMNIGGNILSKSMIYFSLVLAGWFSFGMIKQISKTGFKASILASLFYVFNPLTFNKIIAGHINYTIAYAFAPLFVSVLFGYLNNGNKWSKDLYKVLISGLILALCTVQIQFAVMLIVLLWILIWVYGLSWKKGLIATIVMSFVVFMVHFPWLVTMLIEMIYFKSEAQATPTIFSWYVHNSSQIYQAIFLLGGATDYLYKTLQDSYWWMMWLFGYLMIFLVTIFGLIQIREKIYKRFYLMWLLSVFVLTLPRVIPDLMYYLISKSILFSSFRELYHLAFLAAIIMSFVLAMSIQVFLDKYKNRWLSMVVVFAYAIFLTPFFLDGKLLDNLQTYVLPNEYVKYLDDSGRTLFLPSLQPLLMDGLQYSGFDTSSYYSSTTAISEMGRFSPLNERFATFWQSQMYFNSETVTKVFESYLNMMGVKNVVWRPDIKSDFVKYTLLARYSEKSYLLNNNELSRILFNYQDKIVKKVNNWIVYNFDKTQKIEIVKPCYSTGDWSDFNQIFLLQGKARCNGILLSKDINKKEINSNTVIVNNNDWLSLAINEKDNYIFEAGSAANTEIDPAINWVSNEHSWWYDIALSGYGRLAAMTEKTGARMKIDLNQVEAGNYYLLVQKLVNNKGGEVKFVYQDWQSVVHTQDIRENWEWENLGLMTVNKKSYLNIENLSGVNAIGLVVFIPEKKWLEYNQENEKFAGDNNLILMLDSKKIAKDPYLSFDFAQKNQFYPNYPEYSKYDLQLDSKKVQLSATFTGFSNQNEFASLIYPLDFDVKNTPYLSLYSEVQNTQVQFWEMAIEIDQNGDLAPDLVLWKRLNNGQNILTWRDFEQKDAQKIDFDKVKIIGLRFQPHKEYGVDMSQYANKNYDFVLSDMRFYSTGDELVRLPRLSDQIDLNKLTANPSLKMDLTKNNFYNDFPDTKQEASSEAEKITIKSQFTKQKDKQEYSTLILDNNISVLDYPYFTAKLSVSNSELQYYDLAFGIDSNYDNEIDQTIWMDSIKFEKDQKVITFFVDVLNLLQQRVDKYDHPRVLYVKILPHRVNEINDDINIPQVDFTIEQINFYHEGALQSAQKFALPTLHWPIDSKISGDYQLFLNISSVNSGKISGVINNSSFDLEVSSNLKQQWVKVGQVKLQKDLNDLTLLTYDQKFQVHNVALFLSKNNFDTEETVQDVTYQKINPTRYEAQVKIEKPSYIVFKESYHPAWKLKVFDKLTGKLIDEQKPVVMNGWEQGYWLGKTGDFRLEFDYVLTPIYRWGLLVTLFTILLSLIYILISKIWWRQI